MRGAISSENGSSSIPTSVEVGIIYVEVEIASVGIFSSEVGVSSVVC